MRKRNLIIILVILLILGLGFISFKFFNNCDFISTNPNKYCYCPKDAEKESYNVVCIAPPCPTTTYYRCRYFECEVNSDCPEGKGCKGNGKCENIR